MNKIPDDTSGVLVREPSEISDSNGAESPAQVDADQRPLHRIGEVRRQQGVSIRSAARRMGVDVAQVIAEEKPDADLRLSDLYRWQAAMEVPVSDLLVEQQEPLSRTVMHRAQMVRVMKTAATILEEADTPELRRAAQNMFDQPVEIMPELAQVTPWHSVGPRRSLDDYGRAFERRIDDDTILGCLAE